MVDVPSNPGEKFRACNGNPSPRRAAKLTEEQKRFVGTPERIDLCRLVAARMHRKCPYVSLEDFEQSAFMGMADAVKSFDKSLGYKFESFATRRMIGECQDWMRGQGLIHTPRGEAASRYVSIARMWLNLGTGTARDESFEEIFLPPSDVPDPSDEAERAEFIDAWLRGFDERERFIVLEYLVNDRTMKQIGADLDLSESRVSQKYAAIMERLRERARDPRYRELAGYRELAVA